MSSKNNSASGDLRFMAPALAEAEAAGLAGEVPVGAVAVRDGEIIAVAANRVERDRRSCAHAELELISQLQALTPDAPDRRNITVYVTKEPCAMCAGALVNARIGRVVWGADDPRCGGESAFGIFSHRHTLWRCEFQGGAAAEDARRLLLKCFTAARERACELRRYDLLAGAPLQGINALMRECFDFDFNTWVEFGGWQEDFVNFVAESDRRVVAHVGACLLKLRFGGKTRTAIALNGVCCTPEFRGQKLASRLIDRVFKNFPDALFLLFADQKMAEFYGRFGFVPRREKAPYRVQVVDNPEVVPRPLPPEDFAALARTRRPKSKGFDCSGDGNLRLFNMLACREELFLLAPGLAVAARQCGETLFLDDVFCEHPPRWSELLRLLPFRGVKEIEFGFAPDALKVEYRWRERGDEPDLFTAGDWSEMPPEMVFPLYSRC